MSGRRPAVAVLLDENTSGDATRFEASKSYFHAVAAAGGVPYGLPFIEGIVEDAVARFDGLLCTGGRFAYPHHFYVDGAHSPFPPSQRPAIEAALVEAFLERDRPVLGICAGMQMLACLHGARMVPDVGRIGAPAQAHDGIACVHPVTVDAASRLAGMVAATRFEVNSRHREAVVEAPAPVVVAARADDGVIEAIEITGRRFAVGLQWHQEAFACTDHPGRGVFDAFVAACRAS